MIWLYCVSEHDVSYVPEALSRNLRGFVTNKNSDSVSGSARSPVPRGRMFNDSARNVSNRYNHDGRNDSILAHSPTPHLSLRGSFSFRTILSREDPKNCAVKFQEEALVPGSVLGTGVQQQRCERRRFDTGHFRSVNRALHIHNALVTSALILGLPRMQYGCAKPRRALQRLLPRHRMLGLAFVLCCTASSIMVVGSEGAQGIQPWPIHAASRTPRRAATGSSSALQLWRCSRPPCC